MKTPQEIAKERAEVMMAFAEGAEIQSCSRGQNDWGDYSAPIWNWAQCDYRIKPEPPKAEVTPGEWYWNSATDDVATRENVTGDTVCCPPDGPESYRHWPANRHLLAAAKDLRDITERLVIALEGSDYNWSDLIADANKALAKAKGESHE